MIKLENINLKFNNKVLFKDFNLEIKEGEKILLDGPSGKGKTTLVRMLLGFTKYDKGKIYYHNDLVSPQNIYKLRSESAYISQNVELRDLVLHDYINEIFTYRYNKNLSYDGKYLLELFAKFNLNKDLLDKKTSSLSGGERQRVGLVIALVLDRKILLLDEITSGLEQDLKEKIVRYISELNKTIVIISHDLVWQGNNSFKSVRW